MQENFPKDVKHAPAGPVKKPVRPSHAAHIREQRPPDPFPEPGEVSPPLNWPRVDSAEVERRARMIDTAVSFPYHKPLMGAAVPKPVEHEPQLVPARPLLISVPPRMPIRPPRTGNSVGHIGNFTGAWILGVASLLNTWRQKSRPALTGVALKLGDFSQATLLRVRSSSDYVRQRVGAIDLAGLGHGWQRARTMKVTIRIPRKDFRRITALGERAAAFRVRLRKGLSSNPRLWTSAGMAGLSALLALAMVSGLRHYEAGRVRANESSGTDQMHAATSPAAKPASSTPSKPVEASAGSGGNPTSLATASKTDSTQSSQAKTKARRRNADDDYVAKDTYVVYGRNGKPLRRQ